MTPTIPPAEIGMLLENVDTPALLIDLVAFERNLDHMAQRLEGTKVRLRPHVKTHKCVPLARLQVELGASGLTCAKVSEAAVFADAGFDDLLVAFPLVASKTRALRALAERAGVRVATIADSLTGVAP